MAMLSESFPRPSLLARVGNALTKLMVTMAEASHAGKCAALAQRLHAMSDEELEKVGISRDEIVHFAFRRYLY